MKTKLKLILVLAGSLLVGANSLAAKGKPAHTAAPSAHTQGFHKGNFFFGGGLGLGSGLGYLGGIALIANAEYAITNEIGVGGSVGYWSYSEDYSYSYGTTTPPYSATGTLTYKYSIIPVIVSGAYHFKIGNPKIDLAAGISLGYYVVNASSSVSGGGTTTGLASATASGVAWGVFGLARYFVTDNLALRGKLGYGITVVEVGVDFRI